VLVTEINCRYEEYLITFKEKTKFSRERKTAVIKQHEEE
jgi:hypothetical protein